MINRPMLAASAISKEELEAHMPEAILASPKLDGIRCLLHPELGAVSRNFKPIPNEHIRNELSPYHYLDGEIVTFTDGLIDDFNTVQSKVMTRAGKPDFELQAFDHFKSPHLGFVERYGIADLYTAARPETPIKLVEHRHVDCVEDFLSAAGEWMQQGYEGAMYRCIHGAYKSGRSTLRQGWLVKWKDIQDAEGTVVDFIERMHNDNEQTKDAFGLAERTSHQENMKPMNTLGALVLNTQWGTLRVGTGFDDIQRKRIWQNRDDYMGKTVTFKYQPHGVKNLPRFPVFKCFREKE